MGLVLCAKKLNKAMGATATDKQHQVVAGEGTMTRHSERVTTLWTGHHVGPGRNHDTGDNEPEGTMTPVMTLSKEVHVYKPGR